MVRDNGYPTVSLSLLCVCFTVCSLFFKCLSSCTFYYLLWRSALFYWRFRGGRFPCLLWQDMFRYYVGILLFLPCSCLLVCFCFCLFFSPHNRVFFLFCIWLVCFLLTGRFGCFIVCMVVVVYYFTSYPACLVARSYF